MAKRKGKRLTAWNWFSRYRRLKYANDNGYVKCVSCGRIYHWKKMQAGHFVHSDSLDFTEENLGPQCIACNHYQKTKAGAGYHDYMLRTYGQAVIDKLHIEGRIPRPYTDYELTQIAKKYRLKVKEILKKKGIVINP